MQGVTKALEYGLSDQLYSKHTNRNQYLTNKQNN